MFPEELHIKVNYKATLCVLYTKVNELRLSEYLTNSKLLLLILINKYFNNLFSAEHGKYFRNYRTFNT